MKPITKESFMYGLGALIVIGFIVWTIALAMFIKITPDNSGQIGLLTGAWITFTGMVIGYFYGSSKGSADKTEIMKNGNGKNQDTATK